MKRMTVLLPAKLKNRARRMSRELGVSVAELIRRGLKGELDEEDEMAGPDVPAWMRISRKPRKVGRVKDTSERVEELLYGPAKRSRKSSSTRARSSPTTTPRTSTTRGRANSSGSTSAGGSVSSPARPSSRKRRR